MVWIYILLKSRAGLHRMSRRWRRLHRPKLPHKRFNGSW